MHHKEKKAREKAVIKAFLRWQGYPSTVIEDCDREAPDAIIGIDGQLVGVEVTAATHANARYPTRPQRWVAEATSVVSDAQTVFEARNPRALVVQFGFRPEWAPLRDERRSITGTLAAFVEDTLRQTQLNESEPLAFRDPLPGVAWAFIGNTNPRLGGLWAPSIVSDVERASAEDIAATVRRKEVELPNYLQVAPASWLLITCDVTGQGVAMEIPEPTFGLATGFARVFCCGFGYWEWVEIPAQMLP